MIEIKVLASSSSGNCYLIDDGKTKILLEAGISLKRIQKGTGYKVTSVEGCLITHEHQDHSKAVNDLMGLGIDCYMSKGTAKAINAQGTRCKEILPKQTVCTGSWIIKPFDVRHDAAEPFGYLLLSTETNERLVFITDSYYVPYKFANLDYIMIECNYSNDMLFRNVESGEINEPRRNRIMRSHMSLDNCKEFLKANDLSSVKEIHLLHLSDGNSVEDQFKKEIAALTGLPVYVAQK